MRYIEIKRKEERERDWVTKGREKKWKKTKENDRKKQV